MKRRDQGSFDIRAVLDRPSDRLLNAHFAIMNGLQVAPDQEYGVPPQYLFDGIGDARQYYREIRAEIDAISTTNAAKFDVISAIDRLDRGWERLERAYETGVSRKGLKRMKDAKRTLKAGTKQLRTAKDRL